ncbi:MAG: hypothetical protein JXJ22_03045 [Bacteroidales bacterium]|nr:hypothetical protein [Bacteroidales bacterium]
MKKSILLLMAVLFLLNSKNYAQENEEKNFGIKFSGFVKNDFFFDSRQTTAAREGHFLLWPSAVNEDINGDDINAKSNFNFLAVQSRLTGVITGPDAFGAKTSGVIEGDFFAQADDNINLFRLRHAFIKLKWSNTELLTGQYWNPLFVTGCFPGTVSFNTGTPLQSFARNPQIRLTQNFGNLQVILAALSQRDYTSRGPDPVNNSSTKVSSDFLRNSSIPDLHFQVHYSFNDEASGTNILFGAGAAYKTIVPRLYAVVGADRYKVDEKVGGVTAIVFTKLSIQPITLKLQGRYGENIADVLSISGFAVKDVEDVTSGERSYTPLKNITFWGEAHTNGKKVQLGVFGGYLKNLGTKDAMSDPVNSVYGLATNIESLLRVSPRVIFISNKTKIACEMEYTSAAYGSNYDVNYVPANTTSVSNLRVLLSVIYSF